MTPMALKKKDGWGITPLSEDVKERGGEEFGPKEDVPSGEPD